MPCKATHEDVLAHESEDGWSGCRLCGRGAAAHESAEQRATFQRGALRVPDRFDARRDRVTEDRTYRTGRGVDVDYPRPDEV